MKHDNISFKKNGLVLFLITALMAGSIFFTAGCDNKDTYQAQLEDAKMALDKQDYARAKSILETLPRTPEVLQYLSNSIAGKDLNLDTLHIITTLDDLNKTGKTGSIDMVGTILGDTDNKLTAAEIADKLDSVDEAIDLLKEIASQNGISAKASEAVTINIDSLTNDQKIQLGLLSISQTVLIIAKLVSAEMPGVDVEMTEDWIKAHKDVFKTVHPSTTDLQIISEDLANLTYAIEVFANTSDFKDDFQSYKNKIDTNQNGQVSADEINAYLSTM